MNVTGQILNSHPGGSGTIDPDKLRVCVEACYECAQACTACADACLGERSVADLTGCVRLNLDCADVCEVTGRVLSRQTKRDERLAKVLLEACAHACKVCGDECERHTVGHRHCRECAEVCRRCERACRELLASL